MIKFLCMIPWLNSYEWYHLWLFSISHRRLQQHLNESNISEQNHIEIICEINQWSTSSSSETGNLTDIIKSFEIHVECLCCPQKSRVLGLSKDLDMVTRTQQNINLLYKHLSLPSNVGSSMDMTSTSIGPELGFGSTVNDGFDLGSSLMAHTFINDDSDFNLYPPSKKRRTTWSNFEEMWLYPPKNSLEIMCILTPCCLMPRYFSIFSSFASLGCLKSFSFIFFSLTLTLLVYHIGYQPNLKAK